MTDRDDDLPTEAVPRWPDQPPGPAVPPPPDPTRVMPVIPAAVAGSGGQPPPIEPVLTPGGGAGEPPGRPGWLIAGIITAVVVVVGVLLAVLLLRNDDETVTDDTTVPVPTLQVPTTPVTVPPTAPPTAPPTEAPTTTVEPSTTTEAVTTTTTTTTAPAPTWPAALRVYVAAPDGVHLVQDGADDIVAAQQVAIALALPGGDLLVQDRSGRYDRSGGEVAPGATTIRRIGSGGESVLLAPVGEQWLRLHDVGTVDGVATALVSIRSGNTIEDEEEDLMLLPLAGGASRLIGVIGGWESSTDRLHLGGRGIVGEYFAEALSGPLLINLDGNQLVDPAVLGLSAENFDCGRECPHHFAIDPGGTAIGWLEDRALVVVNAMNGQRLADIQVPADVSDFATELELVNGVAIISRRTDGWSGTPTQPVVVDLATGTIITVAVPGIATAVR